MAENNTATLKTYFGTEERPVTTAEMLEFWKSLTDEEKAYFKSADLT